MFHRLCIRPGWRPRIHRQDQPHRVCPLRCVYWKRPGRAIFLQPMRVAGRESSHAGHRTGRGGHSGL